MSETFVNHLAHEKSPYLLQHVHNPVDWYPWGEEAFTKAKKEDKPILVSIGYSTCHWCHVMEKECFEDPAIASVMNEFVISIKIDREERPDVDKIYMTSVSAMTGSGGWPLNVFLTHDLKPFYGGTYFPPQSKWGKPAWPDLIRHIGIAWKDPKERLKIINSSDEITISLKAYLTPISAKAALDKTLAEATYQELLEQYDRENGGFGSAPKFPMPVYYFFLINYFNYSQNSEVKNLIEHSLLSMANGGIYDHLRGGFARYSTDERWHVPHFEKMLYDNAQLITIYLQAYRQTQNSELMRIAQETVDYILKEMTHPEGGFYSAEDADSLPTLDSKEKKEGAYYVWSYEEVRSLLDPSLFSLFCFRYGVNEKGNVQLDPHQEFQYLNVLYAAHTLEEAAFHFKGTIESIKNKLDQAKDILLLSRSKRARPHLDDKIITAWNGLMISALTSSYHFSKKESHLVSAQKAASFIRHALYDSQNRLLYRRWRESQRQGLGICDDYAFYIQSLIDLYEADHKKEWLALAEELTLIVNERFLDIEQGGYFMTAKDQDTSLLFRVKEDADNVEPSASSVMASNLWRLAKHLNRPDYHDLAIKTINAFSSRLKSSPLSMPSLMGILVRIFQETTILACTDEFCLRIPAYSIKESASIE